MAGKGSAPGERRGGRAKGTPNQLPDLRALTLRALMKAGGVDYLERQASENPAPFLALLGRCIPREVHTELTAEVRIRQEVRRELVEKLVVLLQAQDAPLDASALPAITHGPETMLKAQELGERDSLSRRQENARRDALGTVAGAVTRAAAIHSEREAANDASYGVTEGAPLRVRA